MNEKEAVIQAKENLKASMKVVRRDLKIYGKAVLNRNKAVIKNIGNDIIGIFKKLSEKSNVAKLEKEKRKLAEQQAKVEEEMKKSLLRIQKQEEEERLNAEARERKQQKKEEKKEKRNERFLNFKNGVKQKASSIKSGFGKVKNSVINALRPTNIDAKLRSAFDSVQLLGIKAVNGVVKSANTVKDGVVNFTSEQLARYHEWKKAKDEEKARVARLRDADYLSEKMIRERTRDHKTGMLEAFAERDSHEVQEEIALDVQKIMEEEESKKASDNRKLDFNPNKKQKTKSSNSRTGRTRKSVLNSLNMSNINAKLRAAFDNVQIFGIKAANGVVKGANAVKDGVVNFTSEQIARYSEWRIKRDEEKARLARLKEAERMSEAMIRERTRDHKAGMKEALNAQEREQYDAKHEEFLKLRQELIQSLIDEKNKLFGIQASTQEYEQEESNARHR